MKNIIFTFIAFLFFTTSIFAQAPEAFKYQTVIRGADGQILADQAVTFGIDLLQNGAVVYSEDHSAITNSFGLVHFDVGRGVVVGGDFAAIGWGTPTSIQILLDAAGGSNLQVIGTSELLSVPYALYAGNAGGGDSSWNEDGTNINSGNTGNVGIGTATPNRKLSVQANDAADGAATIGNLDAAGFAGTYFESANDLKGYIGHVGSGNWVEPNSFQIGTIGNADFKYINSEAGAALMTIKPDGKMGVGTTTPNRTLSVQANNASDGAATIGNLDAAGFAGTYFESANDAKGLIGYVGSGSWIEPNSFQIATIGNTDLKYVNSNSNTALMTIKPDGKMGVGTTNPNRVLTVESNVATDGVMTVRNANAAGFAGTYFESANELKGYVGHVGGGSWVDPNSFQVGALGNTDLKFIVNSSNAMTIKGNSLNIGIGNANPAYKLSVYHGDKGVEIKNLGAGNAAWEMYHNASNNQLQLRNATGTSVGHFDYNSGVYMATSDRKLKRNIQPMAAILPSLMLLDPVKYHYASDNEEQEHLGFIAQEVENVFPELVANPNNDTDNEAAVYRMNYTGFGVIAVKAIQEQQKVIEDQQTRLDSQEATIEQQEARLNAIETALNKAGISLEE